MNIIKTTLGMAMLFALFMAIGQMLGGQSGATIGFAFALIMNFGAYWFSDSIALMSSGAVPVAEPEAPELYAMVRHLAEKANLPTPRIYRIPTEQPNAFATGRDPAHAAIAVTDGIWRSLSREELEGVLAHELSHVKHRDTLISTIVATLAGAIGMVASMARWAALFGGLLRDDDDDGGPIAALVLMIVAPIAALLIQLAISRYREFDADAGAAKITGRPLALAGALEKIERIAEGRPLQVNPSFSHLYIVNPMGGDRLSWLMGLFRTHPPTPERVARLESMAAHMRSDR